MKISGFRAFAAPFMALMLATASLGGTLTMLDSITPPAITTAHGVLA